MNDARAQTRRHVLILTCLCVLAYIPGLTNHGLTNWQEAQRALVFKQMHERGDWLVPTAHGEPYLAKPPMVYWWQRTISIALGNRDDILPLRLTVAIAGWLGVIATYCAGRVLLRSEAQQDTAATPSLLGAAMLATGMLYARSSRIGELDVLLAWPTSIAVLLAFTLTTRSLTHKNTLILSAVLVIACACASLTKGPPAMVPILCAVVGGHVLCCAVHDARLRTPLFVAAGVAACAAAIVSFWIRGRLVNLETNELIGLAYVTGSIGVLVLVLAHALTSPQSLFTILRRPWSILAILLGASASIGWMTLVAHHIRWDAVRDAMAYETGDNLRLFVLDAPMRNIEAMVYGAGLASLILVVAIVCVVAKTLRHRWEHWRTYPPGMVWLVAWVFGSLFVFSIIGKGVPRYLTPVWPGVALLAGIAVMHTRLSHRHTKIAVFGVCTILAVAQGWWYGYEREARFADRSPRNLINALVSASGQEQKVRLFTLDHWSPALDFYFAQPVTPVIDNGPEIHVAGVHPVAIADFVRSIDASRPVFVIARDEARVDFETIPPADRFAMLGLIVQEIKNLPEYRIDNGRTTTRVLLLSMPTNK